MSTPERRRQCHQVDPSHCGSRNITRLNASLRFVYCSLALKPPFLTIFKTCPSRLALVIWFVAVLAQQHQLVPKVDEYLDKPPKEPAAKGSSSRNPTASTAKTSKSGAAGVSSISGHGASTSVSTQEVQVPITAAVVAAPATTSGPGARITAPEVEASAPSAPSSPSESNPPT